ncbi:cell morphogenesis N-terminal-domain-containing protein [Flagelloscypha sp. PMI_526]|nr:cell morphogenesis N-terminal-domain-containing protein [Flagelloscypha sp. PMI_526]
MGSEGVQIEIPVFDDDDYGGGGAAGPFGRQGGSNPFGGGGFGAGNPFGGGGGSSFGGGGGSSFGGASSTSSSSNPFAAGNISANTSFGGSVAESPVGVTPLGQDNRPNYFGSHSRQDSVASIDSTNSGTGRYTPAPSSTPRIYAKLGFTKKGSFASIRNADFNAGFDSFSPPPVPSIDNSVYMKASFNRSNNSFNTSRSLRPTTPSRGPGGRGHAFHPSDAGSDLSYRSPATFYYGQREGSSIRRDSRLLRQNCVKARQACQPGLCRYHKMHASSLVSSPPNSSASTNNYNTMGPGSLQNNPNRFVRPSDVPSLLHERKILASIYIMCRALIAILEQISKDALGDAMGYRLEELTFETFKKPDLKQLASSVNYRINVDLYVKMLGLLGNIRFTSVTDRFLSEFEPISVYGKQLSKEQEIKFEHLVKGLTHVPIKVWPPEAFEEGAEFLEALSKSFVNAHGIKLKTAFAETLVHMLHPIGKTAQAETNHPQWAQAIEFMYPKAKEMMTKPRYWHAAFPLVITLLCVAPREYFLKHWQACWEASASKLKDKGYRVPVMNGLMRIIWTYLYRCQESTSTTLTKIDTCLKTFFPPNRFTIFPPDDNISIFVYIVHFVLSRHFDFGTTLCLELMQEQSVSSSQPGSIGSVYAPERTSIAVKAMLLSLHAMEKDIQTPTWPSTTDFMAWPSPDDYPTSSGFKPASLTNRNAVNTLLERAGAVLGKIALACQKTIGNMNVFDEQWSTARLPPGFEESHTYVICKHPDAGVTAAYPAQLAPVIQLLHSCFISWPRCLIIPPNEAIEMLLMGIIHVEPSLTPVSAEGLMRFMENMEDAKQVVSQSTSFIFSPSRLVLEGAGIKLLVEAPLLLDLWVRLVQRWVKGCLEQTPEAILEDRSFVGRCAELEAAILVLLSHEQQPIFEAGATVTRTLHLLVQHLAPEPSSQDDPPDTPLLFTELLYGKHLKRKYMDGFQDVLDKAELARLDQWKTSPRDDIPLRIVQSLNERDRALWRFIFPAFLCKCMEYPSSVLNIARDAIVAAVSRYHPIISHLAGLSTRVPVGLNTRTPFGQEKDGVRLIRENRSLVNQWCIWLKILCCTATMPETRPTLKSLNNGRDQQQLHNRAPSDINFERERFLTTRGLFRYLTPFLDSEYLVFRDSAVWGISAFPSSAYPNLLDDLSMLAGRQFYDDSRSKFPIPNPLEQGMGALNPRQLEEAKNKAAMVMGDRTRRQERLHSAIARIYWHTAPYLHEQRGMSRQTTLVHVLKFVRTTQTFLVAPDTRDDPGLHRLRRYFCGVVERLLDAMSATKDFDRLMQQHTQLALYRLCEEWCLLGPQTDVVKHRMDDMLRAAVSGYRQADVAEVKERFNNDSLALSYASIGALAALCHKAYFPSDGIVSPTERIPAEFSRPLSAGQVLERFTAILGTSHLTSQKSAKKAMKTLLSTTINDSNLFVEAVRRSVVGDKQDMLSHIICECDNHGFTFPQVVCLGLTNLGHPLSKHRRESFNMLEAIHHQHGGLLAMSQFEASVGSISSTTYIHAHRLHPQEALSILTHFSAWLPQLPATRIAHTTASLLLESLEYWDKTGVSKEGRVALFHLLSITLRYANDHMEQILAIWTQLIEPPNQANGHATIPKVSKPGFINTAANIVSCLCQTVIGREIFDDLVSLIDPLRMLPSMEHKLNEPPNSVEVDLWSDLLALFEDVRSISLGSAQYAWLFLADVAMSRYWELKSQMPVLLHASNFVRTRAQPWAPGYDELHDRASYPSRSALKAQLSKLEEEAGARFWKDDDSDEKSSPNMKWLCKEVLNFVRPLCPNIAEAWGSLALHWGTACSIRLIAFRSLQIFRALMPKVQQRDLALLLGRLSNTIAGPESPIQLFTLEIIATLTAIAGVPNLDSALLPKLYWCCVACLSTTAEREFSQALLLLEALLPRLDFDDIQQFQLLTAQQPDAWKGSFSVQFALLKGLRSSVTSPKTLTMLQRLSKFRNSNLIEPTPEARVRDLYTLALPWCLHDMTMDKPDPTLATFAEDIKALAEFEERTSIQKIMNGFIKRQFRTKDDFLRQSISVLREHYGSDYWTDIVTLLMSLVLNNTEHVRTQAMNLIKILFQQRETRGPIQRLGSEILMPLLRLLDSNLSQQALDVLEEPMVMMSGGAPAKQVLRMSMHAAIHQKEVDSVTKVFGVPEESGWCIAQVEALRETCRANIVAVFDTCAMNSRPSRIDFAPEAEALSAVLNSPTAPAQEDDLGGLVQNLHELTSFFKAASPSSRDNSARRTAPPDRRLEARVAAILAKSTAHDTSVQDVPQTPFVDVFRVGLGAGAGGGGGGSASSSAENGGGTSDDSDGDSGSETEADAFMYDQPSSYRHGPRPHYPS